jgi:hypothetical protein
LPAAAGTLQRRTSDLGGLAGGQTAAATALL